MQGCEVSPEKKIVFCLPVNGICVGPLLQMIEVNKFSRYLKQSQK